VAIQDAKARKARQFVTIPFATKDQPDGFSLVHAAARQMGMKVRTYIRHSAIRAATEDLARLDQARSRTGRRSA